MSLLKMFIIFKLIIIIGIKKGKIDYANALI